MRYSYGPWFGAPKRCEASRSNWSTASGESTSPGEGRTGASAEREGGFDPAVTAGVGAAALRPSQDEETQSRESLVHLAASRTLEQTQGIWLIWYPGLTETLSVGQKKEASWSGAEKQ
jgi:hypothetical protein